MKKQLLFILTLAYFASTIGGTIHIQQCMGKTIGWSISEKTPDKCSKCNMSKKQSNDCCKTHVKVLKTLTDQSLPEIYLSNISSFTAIMPTGFAVKNENFRNSQQYKTSTYYSPPPNTPRNILYCTFLI